MRYWHTIWICFALLSGCLRSSLSFEQNEAFKLYIRKQWIAAVDIHVPYLEFINQKKPIERPYSLWVKVLRLKLLAKENFSQTEECLFYKVPSRRLNELQGSLNEYVELLGSLRIYSLNGYTNCDEARNGGQILIGINGIKDFQVDLPLFEAKKKKMGGRAFLKLKFKTWDVSKQQFQAHDVRIPFYNIRSKPKFERHAEAIPEAWIPGLTVLSSVQEKANESKLWGEFEDLYAEGKQVFCHRLNENCQPEIEYQCQRCRFGWHEVGGGKCPLRQDKVCGPSRCGQKGELACPRGEDYLRGFVREIEPCAQDTPVGFCRPGLVASCDSNKNLVCL